MPTPEPDALLLALAERVRRDLGLDLGLDGPAASVARLSPQSGFAEARRTLTQRAADVQAAGALVAATLLRIRQLERIVRFTEQGWPELRNELMSAVATDPVAGVAAWLEAYFEALAGMHLDAVDRLLALGNELPSGAARLIERGRATVVGLGQRSWPVASPLLLAGAKGIGVGTARVPSDGVRRDLRLLAARLALASDPPRPDDAEQVLTVGGRPDTSPGASALLARVARLRGDSSEAADLVADADRTDLDVSHELILQALQRGDDVTDLELDPALAAARAAIGALTSLDDIQSLLERLLKPLPPELHLAVAERAELEGDLDLATQSLAEALESGGRPIVRGEVNARLSSLKQRAGDQPSAVWHALQAGISWEDANRYDQARACYERLLEMDPAHVEGRLRLADTLRMVAWARPPDEAKPLLHRALELLGAVHAEGNVAQSLSWRHLSEAFARIRVAAYLGEAPADEHWKALLAAMRSVALDLQHTGRWIGLADVAFELDLYALEEAATAMAVSIDGSRDSVLEHVRALANLGEFGPALQELGEAEPEGMSYLAYLRLRRGHVEEAVSILQQHRPDPELWWARWQLVQGLALSGRLAEAVEEAKDLDASVRSRGEEILALHFLASTSLVIGDIDQAWSIANRLWDMDEKEIAYVLGAVELIRGDIERAGDHLLTYAHTFTSLRMVTDWEGLELPLLQVLLEQRGRTLPPLPDVERACQQVREKLAAQRDPAVELAVNEAIGADPQIVATAKELGTVLIAIARGRAEDAAPALDLLRGTPGFDEEIGCLQEWLDARHRADLARSILAAVGAEHWDEARAELRQLLEQAPWQADDLLRDAAGADGIPGDLLTLLDGLSTQPDVAPTAELVREWLAPAASDDDGAEPADEWQLRIELPPALFDDYDDPVNQHALFLRHLPELRMTSEVVIPPVRVTTDEDLSADGRYRLLVNERVVEEGSLQLGWRLAAADALSLLPSPPPPSRPAERPLADDGEVAILEPVEEGSLTELVTQSTLEAVCRRLHAVVIDAQGELTG